MIDDDPVNTCVTPVLNAIYSVNNLSPIQDLTIPMRVSNNGTVRWAPPSILSVSCEMDPTYFPFDKHSCFIQVRPTHCLRNP